MQLSSAEIQRPYSNARVSGPKNKMRLRLSKLWMNDNQNYRESRAEKVLRKKTRTTEFLLLFHSLVLLIDYTNN